MALFGRFEEEEEEEEEECGFEIYPKDSIN